MRRRRHRPRRRARAAPDLNRDCGDYRQVNNTLHNADLLPRGCVFQAAPVPATSINTFFIGFYGKCKYVLRIHGILLWCAEETILLVLELEVCTQYLRFGIWRPARGHWSSRGIQGSTKRWALDCVNPVSWLRLACSRNLGTTF